MIRQGARARESEYYGRERLDVGREEGGTAGCRARLSRRQQVTGGGEHYSFGMKAEAAAEEAALEH